MLRRHETFRERALSTAAGGYGRVAIYRKHAGGLGALQVVRTAQESNRLQTSGSFSLIQAGRMDVLRTIVKYNEPDEGYQIALVMELAVRNIESQHGEVRNAANELIFECFKKVGFDRIEPMLTGRITSQ